MSFAEFNKKWVDNLVYIKDYIQGKNVVQSIDIFLNKYEARFPTLPIPLVIENSEYEELCQASKLLVEAQTSILKFLLSKYSKNQILEMFNLPSQAEQYVDWRELELGEKIIARPDIIPSTKGYKFCELNVESSLGGIKFFDCYNDYCNSIGWKVNDQISPRKNIAKYLKKIVLKHNFKRVIILTLKQYLTEGSGTVKSLLESVKEQIQEIPVLLCDEENYPENLFDPEEGRNTLIYRLALYDDINCHSLFTKIFDSGATMINTFETEIRSNKKWFALFHDVEYKSLLTEQEYLAILKYTPYTICIFKDNIDFLMENKDKFVFKANRSYGGVGVFIGFENETTFLKETLKNAKEWTAQEYFESEILSLPENISFDIKQNKIVLGLFQILDDFSGIVVRGSTLNSIVNVTNGAKIGWAFPTSLGDRDNLIEDLREKSAFFVG